MSESSLHQHFRDDGNVPIPIPPADDSWKLMEQRLNEVMPVTHQAGGEAAPDATGIIAKILPAAKYAAAALFVSGVVLYGIYKAKRAAPASTPETAVSPVSVKDSATKATDSLTGRINTVGWPDTTLLASNTAPAAVGANNVHTPLLTTKGTLPVNIPADTDTPAATGAATGNTPAGTNTSAGTSSNNSPAIVRAGKTNHTTAAGAIALKNPLTPAHQQRSGINHTGLPAASPEDHPVAVIGLADVNHTDTTAMLEPGLPVRPTLQRLPLSVNKTANSPLKVSRETMDQLTKRPMPPSNAHLPGYWQLMAQWRIPVPVGNNPALYNGSNGHPQLYRLLVPGISIQRTWRNAALSLGLNLMTTQLYRNEPYYDKISPVGANDLITRTLLQTYGYSASVAYHHRIAGNFFGGAGVQAYYGHTASILETVKYRDTTGNHTKITTYAEKSKIWNNIGNFQGHVTGEIYYDHARWQAAVRTVVPVLHTARDSTGMNMKPAPQVELMLRWKINRRK